MLSVAVVNAMAKAIVYFHSLNHLGKSGQNLEAGTEAKTIEEHCLLACSPWLSHPALLCHPGPSTQG